MIIYPHLSEQPIKGLRAADLNCGQPHFAERDAVHIKDNPNRPAVGMGFEGQHTVPLHSSQSHVLKLCPRPAERHGASYWVVLKVQQIVRQPSMFAA